MKNKKELVELRDNGNENKKVKDTKKCAIERKIKSENHKNCLEATQLENKINYPEKNEINIDFPEKDHKDFIKNNKLIFKKRERHNVFTEKINKVALGSNYDKRMQSIDSIEAYAFGTSKDLVSEKEEIKCRNIIKQYKND